jgi:hypothetical protein
MGLGVIALLRTIFDAAPAYLESDRAGTDLAIATTLIHTLGAAGEVFDQLLSTAFASELTDKKLFDRLRGQLERNVIAASGGGPSDPKSFTRTPVLPSKSPNQDVWTLAASYLAGTPLVDFLEQPIKFVIPLEARFEHCHIVAGSGHGKSQTLQYLICQDLPAVAAGNRSIIVLDSQGDLIRNIAHLAEFGPDGPLHDRIVLIDPSDVEWPVSLNLFGCGSFETTQRNVETKA